MTSTSRILIGMIVAAAIIVAGISAGFLLKIRQEKNPAPVTHETLKADIPPNHNTYEITPPSRGLMLDLYPIDITPEGTMAFVRLPSKEAADVKTGQKVFLYDGNGLPLDSLGEVVWIEQAEDGMIIANINLEGNPDIGMDQIKKGKIIIRRETNVQRLPYSALIRNEKGDNYIWVAVANNDGTHTAYYKHANVTGGNDLFFSIEQGINDPNIFIVNPDAALRDGQKINVREFLYQAPPENEDQRIASIVEDRKMHYAVLRDNPPSQGAAPVGGCPTAPPNITQDFINKVKSLAQTK